MARTLYDALDTAGIPAGAEMAAWYPHDTRNKSGAPKGARQVLTIDNTATGAHPDCHIADAETGAMEWADVPGWVQRCTRPQPTAYASLGNTPALFAAMAGVTRHWYLWVARYLASPRPVVPAVPGLPANCTLVGCQWTDAGPYDLSVITDDNWYPMEEAAQMESVGVQNNWRHCEKCGGAYFAGAGTPSVCPAGGAHEPGPSYDYALPYSDS